MEVLYIVEILLVTSILIEFKDIDSTWLDFLIENKKEDNLD